MKKNIIIGIVLFFVSVSCSAQNFNTRQYLCDKKWQLSSSTVSPAYEYHRGKGKQTDLLLKEQDCKKDDYYEFTYKQTFTLKNGAKKCMTNESDIIWEGTWALRKGAKTVFIVKTNSGNSGFEKIMTELTENKLVLTKTKLEEGVTYTFTETYSVIK